MAKLTVQEAYKIAKRLNPNKTLWRCIDNSKEWGFMFNPIGVEEDLYGASYHMIRKNGRKTYELVMAPGNLKKVAHAKQFPIELIIGEGGIEHEKR